MQNRIDLNKKLVSSLSAQQTLDKLASKAEGLSSEAAKQRRTLYGPNAFKTSKRSALRILARQFQNAIVYLLLVAGLASFLTGDSSDGLVITAILFLNALLGFVQEYRSERALEALLSLVQHHVLTKRDGKNVVLEQDQLVPGDVIVLKEGDIVPADGKILQAEGVLVNEAALSGESVPVLKATDPSKADPEATLVFAGSIVQKGEVVAAVYATGEATELGQIAHLSTSTAKVTRYGKSLESLSFLLTKLALLMIVPIFVVKLVFLGGSASFAENLVFMFAFAIAVVPEALPVIVTVTLASGALRLAKQHVVVRELSAMEDFGNITLLCTDKTGTLTENKMTITDLVAEDPEWLQVLAYASIEDPDSRQHKYTDPYDLAIDEFVPVAIKSKAEAFERVKELPFDPEARRRWVVIRNTTDHQQYLLQLGSAETLLKESDCPEESIFTDILTEDGKKGLRDLAVTCKKVASDDHLDIRKSAGQSDWVGYFKFVDPLRPSAKDTIEQAEQMGLDIKILTGDSKEVARYVAEEVGLLKPDEPVYSGAEIEQMSEGELKKILPSTHVFAKVTPVQKYNLIKLMKETDVVGYQGDGINDAPSLKLADVAVAVDTATDVAKEEADVILLRPDLEVIINGIQDGRTIFANVNKYIRYTMVANFSQFFVLAVLYLLGTDLPLLPRQLLVVSTFTQIPLLAIAADAVSQSELRRPSHYNIRRLMTISLSLGIVTAIYQLLYFFFVIAQQPADLSQTSLFLFLSFVQLIVIFSVRTRDYFWRAVKPSLPLVAAIALAGASILLMTYWGPLKELFALQTLPIGDLIALGLVVVVYLLVVDVVKVWNYRMARSENNLAPSPKISRLHQLLDRYQNMLRSQ